MTYSARTVTPRVLWADARRHEMSLRVFCDSDDWSAIPRSAIARDPEWLYHESAMEACATVSARLFSEALGLTHAASRLPVVDATCTRTVTARVVSVIASLEAVSGTRPDGEREPSRRAGTGRSTARGILAVVRRGGRLHAAGGD
ncbi:MAG: hypothetical protein JWM18_1804 [Chloroflexi bacterium]|jgi:hypothetical protein|nr:hypothetical protein [Chloroflexota bacterium]